MYVLNYLQRVTLTNLESLQRATLTNLKGLQRVTMTYLKGLQRVDKQLMYVSDEPLVPDTVPVDVFSRRRHVKVT